MKKTKDKTQKIYKKAKKTAELVGVGSVTGIFAGAVVTLYNLLAETGEEFSRGIYAYVRAHLAFVPLLLLVLALGAFFLGVVVQLSPIVGGSGIPQAEGSARGTLRFKWYREATAMFAASLAGIFMGLSIGAEGPSVQIGCALGEGVSKTLRRDEMVRRYQATGGACTGLAVASNAPLTGMAFAFEEAHKRFTPEVFICAFSSVVTGILVRTLLYTALGKSTGNSFSSFVFYELPLKYYPFVLLASLIMGVLGVAFYYFSLLIRKGFSRLPVKDKNKQNFLKIFIAVLLGGICSLAAAGAMGGGHSLIQSLGTFGGTKDFTPVLWTLLIAVLLRFLVTGVNIGSGIPCGIFVPIIAVGAGTGALLNKIWIAWGMEEMYADLLVMICMATFFVTIVRAPITGIVMTVEFTWSFAPLLPVIIGVSVGYLIGEASHTEGIYETLLVMYEHEHGIGEHAQKRVYTFHITHDAIADGREIRDVLWPSGALVTEVLRKGERILPEGDTQLLAGDILTIVCKTESPEEVRQDLKHITGN